MVKKLFCDYCGEEIEPSNNAGNYVTNLYLTGKRGGNNVDVSIGIRVTGSNTVPDICISCLKTALTNILSK